MKDCEANYQNLSRSFFANSDNGMKMSKRAHTHGLIYIWPNQKPRKNCIHGCKIQCCMLEGLEEWDKVIKSDLTG